MAEIDYTPEYLDMAEQYKKQFGQTFDGFIYNTEAGIEIMKECINGYIYLLLGVFLLLFRLDFLF